MLWIALLNIKNCIKNSIHVAKMDSLCHNSMS